MKQGASAQLSRYGAIAKEVPMITGKQYFLISSSEQSAGALLNTYTPDDDGNVRVFTTWASVIAADALYSDNSVIFVSPLFTTAPTKAQQLALDASGIVVIQAGLALPDGSYVASTLTAPAFSSTTTNNLFQVNGRVELIDIIGEVTTTVGATITAKFTETGTVGSATDLCATGTIATLAVGGQMFITGTLATAIQTTVGSAFVKQAAPLVLTAGTLSLISSATTTGNAKYRVRYKAIDPGAFMYPLI